MAPTPAWTSEKPKDKRKKPTIGLIFLRKTKFLDVIRPIVWVAKICGISAITIESVKGQTSVRLSSKCAVRYSYVIMIYSAFYQSVLLYFVYMYYRNVVLFAYLGGRTLITTITHYSLLQKRKTICEVFHEQQELKIDLPRFYTALPVVSYFIVLLTSALSTVSLDSRRGKMLGVVTDIRPPIFSIYSCFIYACQVGVLRRAFKSLNKDIQELSNNPAGAESLRPLIARYLLLRQVCNKVNDSVGMAMLLTTIGACWEITYALFASIVLKGTSVTAISLLWCLLHMIPEIGVMLACQQVENEVVKCKSITTELQLRHATFPPRMKEEVNELQLQLRQLPMAFSAGGWFNLNCDQLRTAVSTVITYTIILIQTSNFKVEGMIRSGGA